MAMPVDRNIFSVASDLYEPIQVRTGDYLDLPRRMVPATSLHNTGCQNTGNRTLWKIIICLGLLCVLLTVAVIVLGSIKCLFQQEKKDPHYNPEVIPTELLDQQWWYYRRSFYFISWEKKTWDDSNADCKDREGNLVTIFNKEEMNFVSKLAALRQQNVWIGLSDRTSEGKWIWTDGRWMNKQYWKKGQPNNNHASDEDCVSQNTDGWYDSRCDEHMYFICKMRV